MSEIKQTIQVIDHELIQTLNAYQEWFELAPDVLSFKPRAGWSIEQNLEHVTLTNHYLLILIRKGQRKALELSAKKDMTAQLESYRFNLRVLDAIAEHNSFNWIRPEHMEPRGEKQLTEVRSLLAEQMNECRSLLKEIDQGQGILYQTTMTVNNLGKIDVYQYIYFLCQHAKRHLMQMQKVKEEYDRFESESQSSP